MSSKPRTAEPGVGMRLALDLGPLAVYFAAFALSGHNIYLATGLFMGVTAVAMPPVSHSMRYRRPSATASM